MSNEIIFVVEDSPEGGYEAKALAHAICTEGPTLDELRAMVRNAVQCHFEDGERPQIIRLHFVKEEVMAV